VGLLIGVIYLDLLARRLPIGGMAATRAVRCWPAGRAIAQWLQVIALRAVGGVAAAGDLHPVERCHQHCDVGLARLLGSMLALGSGALAIDYLLLSVLCDSRAL
jgi:hypothetical protein